MEDILILAIESSCDETSVAIVKNGRDVLSNITQSQIDIHKIYGGVVPEIASRNHIKAITYVTEEALQIANVKLEDIDVIACTYGPGLVGTILVGLSYAKGLAFALNKPLVGINHIEGHIAANYISRASKELEPPFLTLIISGGHTHLVKVKGYTEFEILGKTRDDAIGEAFDKVARIIGLGYPGGPKIDKLAKEGNPNIPLPRTHLKPVGVDGLDDPLNLDFSFSGIKTAILNMYNKNKEINKPDLCASFQYYVTESLLANTLEAAKKYNISKIVLCGGVSANSYIRQKFNEVCAGQKLELYYPDIDLCTDNAAMIGSAGYYNYIAGNIADLNLNAVPNLKINA